MKKLWNFLRSMPFGMLLLMLILLCALPGSLIEQGSDPQFYRENYAAGELILSLELDHIFSSWYFAALLGLLCLNLLLCSTLRLKSTLQLARGMEARMQAMPLTETTAEGAARIEALMRQRRMRCIRETEERRIYRKNPLGHYGAFITHLGLLLSLLFAAGGLYFAKSEDLRLCAGESLRLFDGTSLQLLDFRREDSQGSTDYVSRLALTDPHGRQSGAQEIRVNDPLSFGGRKYYQQSYGTLGNIAVSNGGVADSVKVDGPIFLTLDGETGLAVYGLCQQGDGSYIYAIASYAGGEPQAGIARIGEVLEVGGVGYQFLAPSDVSVIRVKSVPKGLIGALYAAFGLLILGLYLCFFATPAYAGIGAEGYALFSPRRNPLMLAQIARIMQEYGRPES